MPTGAVRLGSPFVKKASTTSLRRSTRGSKLRATILTSVFLE